MAMRMMMSLARQLRWGLTLCLTVALASCSSGPERPRPAELAPNPNLLGVRLAWSVKSGQVMFPLDVKVGGDVVVVASSEGTVKALQASSGAQLWRAAAGSGISAGVGFDGQRAAVVTQQNELVVIEQGKEIWRAQLSAQGFTAPLVAGGRVFVLAADRSLSAYDGATGRRLWVQASRSADSLVLRQAGVLLAVGDTLVAGVSGRLVGFNPSNGSIRWEAAVASARGTNELERLVDLIGPASRVGDVVCTRAYQSALGCVNALRGNVLWSKASNGFVGVHGDERQVYGVEGDGTLVAWQRTNGERAWSSELLKYRRLSAPLAIGRSVAVGDDSGQVHLLSREDGAVLNRLSTDGSPIAAAPVLANGTLVVVTRNGGVFGFKPE
jgi:outer membrane assembly lipoprotein YfgL